MIRKDFLLIKKETGVDRSLGFLLFVFLKCFTHLTFTKIACSHF